MLSTFPKRAFYYSFHRRNVNFPLNIGYNNFTDYSQHLKLSSAFKYAIYRKLYDKTFKNAYRDLLRGISEKNPDLLMILMENNMYEALGAKIYELGNFEKVEFEELNKDSPIEVSLINHYYIYGVDVSRNKNGSLENYTIKRKGNDMYYMPRLFETEPITDEEVLDNIKEAKKLTHVTNDPISPDEEAEREKFMNNSHIQSEVMKVFKQIKKQEWAKLRIAKDPEVYDINSFQDDYEERMSKIVNIDPKLLGNKRYKEEMKKYFVRDNDSLDEGGMGLEDYQDSELVKTDLFKFMKIFAPKIYIDFVQIKKIESAESAPNVHGLNKTKQLGYLKSLISRFTSKFILRRIRKKYIIEVFDVIIKSKHRLSMIYAPTKQNYLEYKTDYKERILKEFTEKEEAKESVYNVDVDKSAYDLNDPEFTQMHLFRFEKQNGRYWITDIDLYLEGNRHSVSQKILGDSKVE